MEAGQTPVNEGQSQEGQAGAPPATGTPPGPSGPEAPTAPDASAEEARAAATPEPLDEDEANPARDQAPIATDAQDAIVGDPGLRGEQQPQTMEGATGSADTPVRTSPPPPSAQSGVPLPEDRAAGVEPGPAGPLGPGGVPVPQQGGAAPAVEPEPVDEPAAEAEEREGAGQQ